MAATAGLSESSGGESQPVDGGSPSVGNSNPGSKTPSGRVQSIFEAVDGEGVEPSVPGFDERRGGDKAVDKAVAKKQPPKQKAQNGKLQNSPTAQPAPVEDPFSEVEQFLTRELNPVVEGDEAAPEVDPNAPPDTRADARFQALANARRDAEARAQQVEQAHQQTQAQFQQFQQQVGQAFQELQLRTERLAAQNEMLMRGAQPSEADLDPETRVMKRLTDSATKELDPRFQELNNQLQAMRQERDQERRAQESHTNKQRYLYEADNALRSVVLKGLPEDALSPEIMEEFKEDILAVAWGRRTNMENAAKIVRERSLRRALVFIKSFAKSKQGAQEITGGAPPSATAQGGPGGNSPSLDKDAWHKQGYKTPLDWMIATQR